MKTQQWAWPKKTVKTMGFEEDRSVGNSEVDSRRVGMSVAWRKVFFGKKKCK